MSERRGLMSVMSGGLPFPIDKIDAGMTTLATSSDIIQVSHKLGVKPDFACIYQNLPDWNDVVGGTCVYAVYFRTWQNNVMGDAKESYLYTWRYKHRTSGNALGGTTTMVAINASDTFFKFSRGNEYWATVDANGDPVTYHWMVGTFKRQGA